MGKVKEDGDTRPMGGAKSWGRSHGTYIAGQAAIDGADATAIAMEDKWGAGRLRLLVDTALRERFDRQRYLFNTAIWHGQLEDVRREAERMTKAWLALDRAAEATGCVKLDPRVWELALADGTPVALVRGQEDVRAVMLQGRGMVIYTLEELARLLQNYHEVNQVKAKIPGATVTQVRRAIQDPLDAIRDGGDLTQAMES